MAVLFASCFMFSSTSTSLTGGHPLGDLHPLPHGWDTDNTSLKPYPGGHKSRPFGDSELRCLWGVPRLVSAGTGWVICVPPKAELLLPQRGEILSQLCPWEENLPLQSVLVKNTWCLPMPLKVQFIRLRQVTGSLCGHRQDGAKGKGQKPRQLLR